MSISHWFESILEHYRVPYRELRHVPVSSALRLAEVEHVSGYRVAKTVLVHSGGRPVSVVLPAPARLDLERVREMLGDPAARLATETEIAGWFRGCDPGAVPPLLLRSDHRIWMDRTLAHLGRIVFPAGAAETAVSVRFRDWYRAVRPGVGRFAVPGAGQAPMPPTVLIVEDEPDTNQLLCWLLERQGFVCRGVGEGKEALVLASEVRPAAILLDLMLPDVSGYEVYEQLCRTGPLKSIPFIVISALDDEASRQRGRQLGADAYLTKPFSPETLVAELRGVLADATA